MENSILWYAVVSAAAVILREGIEAALILAAVAGVLKKMQAGARAFKMLWGGALFALLVSIAIIWLAWRLAVQIPEKYQEVFEGVVGIIAVIVLFTVINWLFHHTYVDRWKKYISDGAVKALTGGALGRLALLAFFVVIREGVETALFIQAIIAAEGATSTMGGVIVGVAVTAIAVWGILTGSFRLPVRTVFAFTTVILILLGLTILGSSIHEFQEVGWLPETRLGFLPDVHWMRSTFGIYPYLETFTAQLVLGGLLFLCWLRAVKSQSERSSSAA